MECVSSPAVGWVWGKVWAGRRRPQEPLTRARCGAGRKPADAWEGAAGATLARAAAPLASLGASWGGVAGPLFPVCASPPSQLIREPQ